MRGYAECLERMERCVEALSRCRELSERAQGTPVEVRQVVTPLFGAVEDLAGVVAMLLRREMTRF
jgi:hypothetical protein